MRVAWNWKARRINGTAAASRSGCGVRRGTRDPRRRASRRLLKRVQDGDRLVRRPAASRRRACRLPVRTDRSSRLQISGSKMRGATRTGACRGTPAWSSGRGRPRRTLEDPGGLLHGPRTRTRMLGSRISHCGVPAIRRRRAVVAGSPRPRRPGTSGRPGCRARPPCRPGRRTMAKRQQVRLVEQRVVGRHVRQGGLARLALPAAGRPSGHTGRRCSRS